jgi:hypothetical protein
LREFGYHASLRIFCDAGKFTFEFDSESCDRRIDDLRRAVDDQPTNPAEAQARVDEAILAPPGKAWRPA